MLKQVVHTVTILPKRVFLQVPILSNTRSSSNINVILELRHTTIYESSVWAIFVLRNTSCLRDAHLHTCFFLWFPELNYFGGLRKITLLLENATSHPKNLSDFSEKFSLVSSTQHDFTGPAYEPGNNCTSKANYLCNFFRSDSRKLQQ
jgi:hypothetical protein